MARGVAGGGAEPNCAGRWLRVGPGTAAWVLKASTFREPKSEFFSHSLSLESEGGSRPTCVNALRIFFYFHWKGVLNEASILECALSLYLMLVQLV